MGHSYLHLDSLMNQFIGLRHYVNGRLCKREPSYIILVTAGTVIASVWFWEQLHHQESLSKRLKRSIFKLLRMIPAVRREIDSKIDDVNKEFAMDAIKRSTPDTPYIHNLPPKGLPSEKVIEIVKKYLEMGKFDWKNGYVSGAVYKYDEKLIEMLTEVYGLASYTNPLHSDIFPGVVKMEAEIVRMVANAFHGSESACGTMTSGGSESILMACKAYRDYGLEECGITSPVMILPTTAHPAFEKAASYFKIAVKYIALDPVTYTVKISDVKKAITRNTIMLVGSAPNYPYGTMDDIQALAALGRKYNIPVHVDCCLGGFLAPFMMKAGFQFPPFDFSVPGVTSISADTHKYGFAPKGSSVIMYSLPKYRHHQYCVTTDWPGGSYGSPSVNGSRPGGIIAACWATLMYFGLDGYVESTKKIIDTTHKIEAALRKTKGIFIFGKPATSVIAIGSNEFDIYLLSNRLIERGWNLNPLQFPVGIHMCVTYNHTLDGVADKFLSDVQECIDILLLNPQKPVEGALAIYGMSQSVPDRDLVGDFTRLFLDSLYLTPSGTESVTPATVPSKENKSVTPAAVPSKENQRNGVSL